MRRRNTIDFSSDEVVEDRTSRLLLVVLASWTTLMVVPDFYRLFSSLMV